VIKVYGQFLVFFYEEKVYPGKIIRLKEENVYIFAMEKSLSRGSGQRSQIFLNMHGVTC
jgi:hypothetical protein